jgi:hypothetical protein
MRRLDERVAEAKRLVNEYLTAAMVMVRLDHPLDPQMTVEDAHAYLDRNGFDIALLAVPEVRVVYRDRLATCGEQRRRQPVRSAAASPRSDRLIEHTLELREVARRLETDPVPLLVVGRDGPEYIVTRADFTRSAGQAGVLAVLATLDAQLDDILRPYDAEAWPLIPANRQREIEKLVQRAADRDEEVHRLGYLVLRERFELAGQLRLAERLQIDLGSQMEQECVTSVRNDIAHGREVSSGLRVIEALKIAERLLDSITSNELTHADG